MNTVEPGLNIIYARSSNHCIGADGQVPWQLPDEYAHFEQVVHGYPLIMGRRSYEDHDGLLPNSLNIIVSRQANLKLEPGALLASSLEQAIKMAESLDDRYFVIGGAGLIEEAMPLANCVFESIIDADIPGDTCLPVFNFSTWKTIRLLQHSTDNTHAFRFNAYKHIKPQSS